MAIKHWAVSLEAHLNEDIESINEEINLYHNHMTLKLKRRERWLQMRNYLDEKFGIKVNFSDHHNTYYNAYKYVSKQDEAPEHSESQPNLRNVRSPRTEYAISARKHKSG